jgi:hypothetical protein
VDGSFAVGVAVVRAGSRLVLSKWSKRSRNDRKQRVMHDSEVVWHVNIPTPHLFLHNSPVVVTAYTLS